MKKRDFILIGTIVVIVIIILLFQKRNDVKGNFLRIQVDSRVYGTYSLEEDQVIAIYDTNVCEIKDGIVRMIESSCPDHLCEQFQSIDKNGGTIVCLPNRVVLEIDNKKTEEIPDTVAK